MDTSSIFPENCTRYEKCLFMIMHLSAGLWIFPFLSLCTGKFGGWWTFVIFVATFLVSYLLFKISYTRRTKLKTSLLFSPEFNWAGKEYKIK